MKIAVGNSRMDKKWKNRNISWEDLCRKVSVTIRTTETVLKGLIVVRACLFYEHIFNSLFILLLYHFLKYGLAIIKEMFVLYII